jgi:hypothetical protein
LPKIVQNRPKSFKIAKKYSKLANIVIVLSYLPWFRSKPRSTILVFNIKLSCSTAWLWILFPRFDLFREIHRWIWKTWFELDTMWLRCLRLHNGRSRLQFWTNDRFPDIRISGSVLKFLLHYEAVKPCRIHSWASC